MFPAHFTSSEASLISQDLLCPDSRSPSPVPKLRRDKRDKMNRYDDLSVYGEVFSDSFSEYSDASFRIEKTQRDESRKPKFPVKRLENDLENDDFSHLSYKHIQYMLDDNQKLSDEVTALKAQLTALNGDHVGLAYQYQKLESKCQEKNAELIELEGKITALTVQLSAESEAKIEAQAKFSLAESTIESLNRQMAVMAKSDSAVRLRENYEALLSKLRNQHENEMIVLKGENEGLKYELQSRQADIDKLKAQLIEKDKLLTKREDDKSSNLNDLKQRYEEIVRQTCNRVEYESALKRKDDEIDSLRRDIAALKKNASDQASTSTCSNSCKAGKKASMQEESCHVKELKEEFEKCLVNLQTRRTQIASLQSQLNATKKENSELKEKLKEADRKISETNEFLKSAHEPWVKKIEAHYAAQLEKDLKDAIKNIDESKREEIERSFNQNLEEYVNQFIEYLQSYSELECPVLESNRFHKVFTPLRKLWVKINCHLEDRLIELDQKKQSMMEAREDLEKALMFSKSVELTIQQSSIDEEKEDKGAQMKVKLDKYKKHCHRLIDTHEKEIGQLKNYYSKIDAEREREYKKREEQIIKESSENQLAMYRRLFSQISSPNDT